MFSLPALAVVHPGRIQRAISGKVGLFPYINRPTRKILATSQIISTMVMASRRIEARIWPTGGVATLMRMNIKMGEKKGIKERMVARPPSGFLMMAAASNMGNTSIAMMGN